MLTRMIGLAEELSPWMAAPGRFLFNPAHNSSPTGTMLILSKVKEPKVGGMTVLLSQTVGRSSNARGLENTGSRGARYITGGVSICSLDVTEAFSSQKGRF